MRHVNRSLRWMAALFAIAFSATPMVAWSTMLQAEGATLDYQVLASDVIVRGVCTSKDTTVSNGHIVTTYKVAASKYLKAPAKMTAQTHPVLSVSVLGGRLEMPPIEESYSMMAVLFPGEDVVLFLRSPDSVADVARAKYEQNVSDGKMNPSPLMTNYRPTAMSLSKLTVMKDPDTQTEIVTRIGFDRFGLLPSSEAVRRYVEAYESERETVDVEKGSRRLRIPVTRQPALNPQPSVRQSMKIEDKIRQMKRYTSTYSDFQSQVDYILKNPGKSGAQAIVQSVAASRVPLRKSK